VTAIERTRKYHAKLRAEGLCVACRRVYAPINPRTGKPFWYCRGCRVRSSEVYQATGCQYYWQRKFNFTGVGNGEGSRDAR
jgi:ribosomal protein L37AE/L43A